MQTHLRWFVANQRSSRFECNCVAIVVFANQRQLRCLLLYWKGQWPFRFAKPVNTCIRVFTRICARTCTRTHMRVYARIRTRTRVRENCERTMEIDRYSTTFPNCDHFPFNLLFLQISYSCVFTVGMT